MIGKTIKEVICGEIDKWDECIILKFTDGTMTIIESGNSNSQGILVIDEIKEWPDGFEETSKT